MKKEKSKKFFSFKKLNIAQLNEKQTENLNGGSSDTHAYSTSIFKTLVSPCKSIACIPGDDY